MIDYRLIEAIKNEDYVEARQLINAHVEVNRRDKSDRTALMWAVKQNDLDLVNLLLRNHADVHCTDKYGHTALTLAAAMGNGDIVERLLQAGANVGKFNRSQKTALTLAFESRHYNVVQQLLLANADIDQANEYGETALLSIAKQGKADIFRLLLQNGANVNHKDQSGKTALCWAVEAGDITMVNALLLNNANLDSVDETGKTPLVVAIEKENVALVARLIEANAAISETTLKDKQILRWSHEHQHTAIIEAILSTRLVGLESTRDELVAALRRINAITDHIQGHEYKIDRKILRHYLSNRLKDKYNALTKENSLIKLELALSRLLEIRDGLFIIQANESERNSGKEKSAMKVIKSQITTLHSMLEKLRPPAENTISHKILQLFKVTEDDHQVQQSHMGIRNALTALMPTLVIPNEAEIEQLRNTVMCLSVDQRKQLRETLKWLLDNTAIKNFDDLTEEDKWISVLHQNYKTKERCLPFVVILRVSGSGEKENYNTNTYDHFIQVMRKGAFRNKSGNTPVRSIGFFPSKKEDATGQKDIAKLNKHKIGNNVL